jgi:hypothetical protein
MQPELDVKELTKEGSSGYTLLQEAEVSIHSLDTLVILL